jgi:hypothetical protein
MYIDIIYMLTMLMRSKNHVSKNLRHTIETKGVSMCASLQNIHYISFALKTDLVHFC